MDEIKKFLLALDKDTLVEMCAQMLFQQLVNAVDLAKDLSKK